MPADISSLCAAARFRYRAVLPCLALLLLSAGLLAQTPTAGELAAWLPAKPVTASLMGMASSPRMLELAGRIQNAGRRDPQWFTQYMQAAKPGEPLPYDQRLGVTAGEYREYLELAKTQTGLQKTGEASLSVTRQKDGRIVFQGDGELAELTGVVLDPATNTVTTPFGTCATVTRIKASAAQSATGPWNGCQWKLEEGSVASGQAAVVKMALGRQTEANTCLLNYSVKRLEGGALTKKLDLIVTYPAP